MRAPRYFGSETAMPKALTDRGELTQEAKVAMKAAYEALHEQHGKPSQAKMGQMLGGFTQGGIQKAAAGTAGRPIAEAIAAKLGLDLDGMLAKYGPTSPELIRFRDPRYPNLETAAAMAMAEFGRAIDDVFEERAQRDSDATVEEWLRGIRARYQTINKGPRLVAVSDPDVGGKIDTSWKKK